MLKKISFSLFALVAIILLLNNCPATYPLVHKIPLIKVHIYILCFYLFTYFKVFKDWLFKRLIIFFIFLLSLEFLHSNFSLEAFNILLNDDFVFYFSIFMLIFVILRKLKWIEYAIKIIELNIIYWLIGLNILFLFLGINAGANRFSFFSISLFYLYSYSTRFRADRTSVISFFLSLLLVLMAGSRTSCLLLLFISLLYMFYTLPRKTILIVLPIISIFSLVFIQSYHFSATKYNFEATKNSVYSKERNPSIYSLSRDSKLFFSLNNESHDMIDNFELDDKQASAFYRLLHFERVLLELNEFPFGKGLLYARNVRSEKAYTNTSSLFVFINAYGVFFIFPFLYFLAYYYKKNLLKNFILSIPFLLNILFISNLSFLSLFIFLLGF